MEKPMPRPLAAALLALAVAGLPALAPAQAQAQEFGGLRPRSNPAQVLDALDQVGRSGCRLSQTSVTVGVNRALGAGSSAGQNLLTSPGPNPCRPLVSTGVVAGVNLALGRNSGAEQSIIARQPRGLLATTLVTRGVNLAPGAQASATQRLLNQAGR
jgi:hypothetical protein